MISDRQSAADEYASAQELSEQRKAQEAAKDAEGAASSPVSIGPDDQGKKLSCQAR